MKRILLITIAFWVLLASPGLCLAGALEHMCADNPHGDTCAHEDDCANDPCSGEVLRPDSSTNNFISSIDTAIVPDCLSAEAGFFPTFTILDALLFPDRANLPRPVSDLPLLS